MQNDKKKTQNREIKIVFKFEETFRNYTWPKLFLVFCFELYFDWNYQNQNKTLNRNNKQYTRLLNTPRNYISLQNSYS